MDGHHLDVALRERLVGILVFVDAAFVQQAQEAVEQVATQIRAVAVRHHAVMVVILKDVQKLGEDGQVPSPVFILYKGCEGLKSEQTVKVVGWPAIEGATGPQIVNFRRE